MGRIGGSLRSSALLIEHSGLRRSPIATGCAPARRPDDSEAGRHGFDRSPSRGDGLRGAPDAGAVAVGARHRQLRDRHRLARPRRPPPPPPLPLWPPPTGNFAIGTGSLVMAGLLPGMAADLGRSASAIGQTVTAF